MSAPIIETNVTEPEGNAYDVTFEPYQLAATAHSQRQPWWQRFFMYFGMASSMLVTGGVLIAGLFWLSAVPSSPTQSDTYVQQDKANKVGCDESEVKDATGACVDRHLYESSITSVKSQLRQGKTEFASWASQQGLPASEKTLMKYLCTAAYNPDGMLYVANQIGLPGAPGMIVAQYKSPPGDIDYPQTLVAIIHLPYVSGPMVALARCPVVPSWAE